MADRFWVSSTAKNWSDASAWSATSGGAGGASVPGPSDVARFTASGLGNCTLDGDVGTIIDGGSGAYSIVPGVQSLALESGFAGTLFVGARKLAVDTLTHAAGTFNCGSGQIATRSITRTGGTWTRGTSTVILHGNGATSHSAGTTYHIVVVPVGATPTVDAGLIPAERVTNWGLLAGSLIATKDVINNGTMTASVQKYFAGQLSAGNYASVVWFIGSPANTYNATLVPNAHGDTSLRCTLWQYVSASASTSTLDGATHGIAIECSGNVSTNIAAGTVHHNGLLKLTGPTNDQTVTLAGLATTPSLAAMKFAGAVAITAAGTLALRDFRAGAIDLNAVATLADPYTLDAGNITVRSGKSITGSGTLRRRPGTITLESGASIDLPALELVDWSGLTVPTGVPSKLSLVASASAAGEITPIFDGAYTLGHLTLRCEGAVDLTIDAQTNDPTITLSGNMASATAGGGSVGWLAGSRPIRLIGPGSQVLRVSLSRRGKHIFNGIDQRNVGATVEISEPLWVVSFQEVEGAHTLYRENLKIADQPRQVPQARIGRAVIVKQSLGGNRMSDGLEFHGSILQGDSPVCLAQVRNADGTWVNASVIESISYTVWLADMADAESRVPVDGHVDVEVDPTSVFFDPPVLDAMWTHDSIGYNFRYQPRIAPCPAFPWARRHYLIQYCLAPYYGAPFLVRYRLYAI